MLNREMLLASNKKGVGLTIENRTSGVSVIVHHTDPEGNYRPENLGIMTAPFLFFEYKYPNGAYPMVVKLQSEKLLDTVSGTMENCFPQIHPDTYSVVGVEVRDMSLPAYFVLIETA